MVSAPLAPHISVVPSAGERATRSAATPPPLPGMFSTVTGTFHASLNFCAKRRAVTSVALPGVNPTTMRTGLSGKLACATAPLTGSSTASAAMTQRLALMMSLPSPTGSTRAWHRLRGRALLTQGAEKVTRGAGAAKGRQAPTDRGRGGCYLLLGRDRR